MKLDFRNMTLWSCVWSRDEKLVERTARVLKHTMGQCDFGDVVFFTCTIPQCDPAWKTVLIPPLNGTKWSQFVNHEVPKHIKTSHAMSVHEDGFIIDPSLWSNEFLQQDYIGAPWPDHVVGNGGFNIESRKLMDAKLKLPMNNDPSDVFVCRTHRDTLKAQGIKFAPEGLAAAFSTEQTFNEKPSFGFHGRTVAVEKYAHGWRQIKAACAFKIDVVYIYVAGDTRYDLYARQFIESYHKNAPGEPHNTVIVCNRGLPPEGLKTAFESIPNCRFVAHDNSGFDIGGFQLAAKQSTADLIVFFGASTYLRKPGWLTRMVESYMDNGYALYGAMGNLGAKFHGIRSDVFPHIRTTAFWMPPQLLRDYPVVVKKQEQRYEFEHGETCLTEWARQQKIKTLVVNWKGEYDWPKWNDSPNGFHRGDQSDLLAGDHISAPPFYKTP